MIKPNNYKTSFKLVLTNPDILKSGMGYIFVITHMRSLSSLLCHILGTSSEISGYSEMHQPYYTPIDLFILKCRVYLSNDSQLGGTYVLDKLAHNYSVSPLVLKLRSIKFVFLLREPEVTLKSIINIARHSTGRISYFSKQENALVYYLKRLEKITRLTSACRSRAIYVPSEKLVSDSKSVLLSLTRFLGLRKPLTTTYDIFRHTGQAGYGDPSETILLGEITYKQSNYSDILLTTDVLTKAQKAYKKCINTLSTHLYSKS